MLVGVVLSLNRVYLQYYTICAFVGSVDLSLYGLIHQQKCQGVPIFFVSHWKEIGFFKIRYKQLRVGRRVKRS